MIMKTTFKKSLIATAVISALALTGCGGSSSSSSDNIDPTLSNPASSQFYVVTDLETDASNSDIEGLALNRVESNPIIEQFFSDYPMLGVMNLSYRSIFVNIGSLEWSSYLANDRAYKTGLTVSYEYADGVKNDFNGVMDSRPVEMVVENGQVTKFKYGSDSDYTEWRMVYGPDNKLTQVDGYDNTGTFVSTIYKFSHDANGQLIEEIMFGEVTATRITYEYGTPTRNTVNTTTRIIRQYNNIPFNDTDYTLTGSGDLTRKTYEEYDASARLALLLVDNNTPDDANTEYEFGYELFYDSDGLKQYKDLRILTSNPRRDAWVFTYSTAGAFKKVQADVTRTTNGTWDATEYQFSGGTIESVRLRENNYFDENNNLVAVEYLNDTTGVPEEMVIFDIDAQNRITASKFYESGTANAADFNYLDADNQVNDYSTWVAEETYSNRYYDEKPSCEIIYENTTTVTPTECALEPTPDVTITTDGSRGLK